MRTCVDASTHPDANSVTRTSKEQRANRISDLREQPPIQILSLANLSASCPNAGKRLRIATVSFNGTDLLHEIRAIVTA